MELLYIWINKSKNDFIQQQGFHFSPEYRFCLEQTADGQHYVLSCTRDEDYPMVWKNGNITGLTAIVGENGSGKTTLMECLLSADLYPMGTEDRPEYAQHQAEENSKYKKILIYSINGSVCIYHNFEGDELVNHTGYQAVNINEQDYLAVSRVLESQTRIYMTNGTLRSGMSGIEYRGDLHRIYFAPDENQALAHNFFQKITAQNQIAEPPNRFFSLQKAIASCKTDKDFQMLSTISYYHYLHSEELTYTTFVTASSRLTVCFTYPRSLFQKQYKDIGENSFRSDYPFLQELSTKLLNYTQWMRALGQDVHTDPISGAYLALLFELYFITDYTFWEDDDHAMDFYAVARKLLDYYQNQPDCNEEVLNYYKDGLREITQLQIILSECPTVQNYVPYGDLAYKFGAVIHREGDPERHKAFCSYIDALMRQRTSFVLKYIVIEMPTPSSGEQALQNIFSWLRLPPSYDSIVSSRSVTIRENVLLLLDEVDLYLHPEWQRKFLKLLTDELAVQYADKKIQLVIATHSPLVLSDVPSRNIIYLEKNDDRCKISERLDSLESFGTNIVSLLKDSFYLKRSIGEYAYSRIQIMIEDLQQLKSNPGDTELKERCCSYQALIRIIGEPIIRRKLQMLYDEVFQTYHNDPYEQKLREIGRLLHDADPNARTDFRNQLENLLAGFEDEQQ